MTCVHTGASLVVEEYAERLRCDLYFVGAGSPSDPNYFSRGGAVVARHVRPVELGAQVSDGDYVLKLGHGHWFDRRGEGEGTIVAPVANVVQVPVGEDHRWGGLLDSYRVGAPRA